MHGNDASPTKLGYTIHQVSQVLVFCMHANLALKFKVIRSYTVMCTLQYICTYI